MNDIFESEEFLNFEKLCNSKKLSFLVCVTKLSSCHKPKRGPQYVMSDFFVYDLPSTWERQDIRLGFVPFDFGGQFLKIDNAMLFQPNNQIFSILLD